MEDSKYIKIGNTSILKSSLAGMKKEDFKKTYKGKLNVDIDKAWSEVSSYARKKAS